jgi:hypothetical protein
MNPSTFVFWQLFSLKNLMLAAVFAIMSGTASGELPQRDPATIGAFVGLASALMVLVVGKLWDSIAERRRERKKRDSAAQEEHQTSEIRITELTLQERQDLREALIQVNESGRRILEEQIKNLACDRDYWRNRATELEEDQE